MVGTAFYVYYGVEWGAWKENLPNLLIYIVIILALFWALRKKEKMEDERDRFRHVYQTVAYTQTGEQKNIFTTPFIIR